MFIAVGMPGLLFWLLGRSTHLQSLPARWFLVVLSCWFTRLVHRAVFELPLYFTRARIEGDETYDGVGGNAILLVLGWIEPSVIATLICIGIVITRKVKHRSQAGHTSNQSL
jgi:hypothetical protein